MTDMLRELVRADFVACTKAIFDIDTSDAAAAQLVCEIIVKLHAEIAKNAEAAKRLRALEMAMKEYPSTARLLRIRADEIMRDWAE